MAIVYWDGVAGKICTRCKEWKPVEGFRTRKLSLDGYNSSCRDCNNEESRHWRAHNRERVAELNRAFYEANREERLAYHKKYRQQNKGYFQEKRQEFRQKNPSYHRDFMREWTRAHPDKVQEHDRKRRAAKNNSDGTITTQAWQALKQRYNYTCLRCGRREPEIKLTLDHIVPLSKGGAHSIDNAQPLCQQCNSAKCDRTIDYRTNGDDE